VDQSSAEAARLRSFWNARYQTFSLHESGKKGLSEKYIQLLYRCKEMAYRNALSAADVKGMTAVRIIDAGCGQGFFASILPELFRSATYTGVDISDKAITFLRERLPMHNWVCADITSPAFSVDGSFNLAQSIEVLHLILDDRNHRQALEHLAACLDPDGVMILTDTLPSQRYFANEYIVFRPLTYYVELLEKLALRLVAVLPMYYWIPDMGIAGGRLARLFRMLPPELVYGLDRVFLASRLPRVRQSHDSEMKMLVCKKTR
jgi:SAM-dependent methyltransferase